jgi:hypothetical protein
MWKVGDVEPVRVMGAEGYPYGFNVITEDGKPVVSFAYASRALAEAGATHLDHVGAKRTCCGVPPPGIPGVESSSDFRKLDLEQRRAVRDLAEEYVHGDSRRVASYKSVLNHLVDRAVISGVFLRNDIDIHRGAVLEVGKDIKVLFARHIRIYRGGLLKITGNAKVDCVTISGNLLEVSSRPLSLIRYLPTPKC